MSNLAAPAPQTLTDADRASVASLERAEAARRAAENAKYQRDCIVTARR